MRRSVKKRKYHSILDYNIKGLSQNAAVPQDMVTEKMIEQQEKQMADPSYLNIILWEPVILWRPLGTCAEVSAILWDRYLYFHFHNLH